MIISLEQLIDGEVYFTECYERSYFFTCLLKKCAEKTYYGKLWVSNGDGYFSSTEGSFSISSMKSCRIATPAEKQWYEECMKNKKYTPPPCPTEEIIYQIY